MVSCEKCFKFNHATIVQECRLCRDCSLSENILCDLLRSGKGNNEMECLSFKPNLSIIGEERQSIKTIENGNENSELTDHHKWLESYAMQQWKSDSSRVICELNYHLCLVAKDRSKLFGSVTSNLDKISRLLNDIGDEFEGNVNILCVAEDHFHIHINSSPDYSGDEVARKVATSLETAIIDELSGVIGSKNGIFEETYFIETIG